MRIVCRHGHYAFYPQSPGDLAIFSQFYDLELVRQDDYYTFPALIDLPNFSLKGKVFGNLPALVTFSGKPWEVMKANGFVYSLATDLLVLKEAIVTVVSPALGDFFYWGETVLFQAGSVTKLGEKILSFDAELDIASMTLKIRSLEDE